MISFHFLQYRLFWLKGPLRQYFSLNRAAVSQREEEEKRNDRPDKKMSKQSPPAPTVSLVDPCPTLTQISWLVGWLFLGLTAL